MRRARKVEQTQCSETRRRNEGGASEGCASGDFATNEDAVDLMTRIELEYVFEFQREGSDLVVRF